MSRNRAKDGQRRGKHPVRAQLYDGRVIRTAGRRVVVRSSLGEQVCFLAGLRAVVGDVVRFEEAAGSGGRLVEVCPRKNVLARSDHRGKEKVLASNLGGMLVVAAAQHPPYRPGLVDRYLVAAAQEGIDIALVLTKTDLGVPDDVAADLQARTQMGVPVLKTSVIEPRGLVELREFLSNHTDGPWALVGHSGVGKTSLLAALAPDIDAGPIGEISEYWGTGQHTTSHSWIVALEPGVEVVDSPGIRTFLPSGLDAAAVRDSFPGVGRLACRYRDCLHRPEEAGCVAGEQISPSVLRSYRRLLDEVLEMDARLGHRRKG